MSLIIAIISTWNDQAFSDFTDAYKAFRLMQ